MLPASSNQIHTSVSHQVITSFASIPLDINNLQTYTMKLSVVSTLLTSTLLLAGQASAFVPGKISFAGVPSPLYAGSVELQPEPEGGEELSAVKTMEGSRVKDMGEVEGVKNDDGTVHKFWLTATAEGALIKKLNSEVLKESAKKANFPGFRKGQIPPYAMPQIRGFAVQEGIIQTIQSAVDAYGLKSLSGSDGEVEVLEDVPAIAKTYKVGDDIQFTATFQGTFDPELTRPSDADSDDAAIVDVEAEAV